MSKQRQIRSWEVVFGAVTAVACLGSQGAFASEQAGKAVTVTGQVYARNPEAGGQIRQLKVGDPIHKGEIINTASGASVKLLMTDRSIMDLGGSTLFSVDQYKVKGADSMKERQVQFSVDYGKIRASVNEKLSAKGNFRIKTKSATMGVRGTEFVVLSDLAGLDFGAPADAKGASAPGEGAGSSAGGAPKGGSKTEIVVIEGKVEVAAAKSAPAGDGEAKAAEPKTVALTAGQKLTAKVEEAPASRGPAGEEKAAPAPAAEMKVETLTEKEVEVAKEEVQVEDKTFKNSIVIDRSNVGQNDNSTMPDLIGGMPDLEVPDIDMTPDAFGGLTTYDPGLIGSTVRIKVVFQK